MPTTLNLLLFTQSRLFPQDTAHWALYLRDDGAQTGTLFHASKDSLTSGQTVFQAVPNYPPTASGSLRSSVEVVSGSQITADQLEVQCRAAAQNRPFDLVVNNCQRYCTQILVRLVGNGYITQAQFDALKGKGFHPLV